MDRPWGIRISAFGITGRIVRNRALHSRFGNGFKGQNYPPVGTIGRGTDCFDRIGGESLPADLTFTWSVPAHYGTYGVSSMNRVMLMEG
jgi:hypothetical protein